MIKVYQILIVAGLLLMSFGLIVLFAYIAKKRRGLSPDEELVRKFLPNIDCGMCGENCCVDLAKKIASGECEPQKCRIIKPQNCERIKEYFKPTYEPSTKHVAFVKCKGGCRAEDKYIYKGAKSCAAQEMLHSGSKSCKYACLGCGDCARVCRYRAIKINKRGVAEIDRSKCVGCGACLKVCPNKLIELKPLELTVNVVCNNKSDDPAILKKCEVGCNHCGKCIEACPKGAIEVIDNVPVINREKCVECYKCIAVCPNHVISRM